MLDRHSSISQPKLRQPRQSGDTYRPTGRRVILTWALGALVPGAVFAALELAFANNSSGDGQIATIYVMYLIGFVVFAAIRMIFDPITVLILAIVVFAFGLPVGATGFSLGIYALGPALFAIGGFVVSFGFGLRRRSPVILA